MEVYQAIENRRSHYAIDATKTLTEEEVVALVKHAMKHAPAAFNVQTSRCLIIFGETHASFWECVRATLQLVVPAAQFDRTDAKITALKSGYGTVLFYEDIAAVAAMQEQFSQYAPQFPIWSQQGNGMLQYMIWTTLEAEGLGASLQHYNPLVDEAVNQIVASPATWKLVAQMPFGHPVSQPGVKDFPEVDEYVRVQT